MCVFRARGRIGRRSGDATTRALIHGGQGYVHPAASAFLAVCLATASAQQMPVDCTTL